MGANISITEEKIENIIKTNVETLLVNIINVNSDISNIVVVDSSQSCVVNLNNCIISDSYLCLQTATSVNNVNSAITATTISKINSMSTEEIQNLIKEQSTRLRDTIERIIRIANVEKEVKELVNSYESYLSQEIKNEINKKFKISNVSEQSFNQNIELNCNKSQVYNTQFVQTMLLDTRLSGGITDISNSTIEDERIVDAVNDLVKKNNEQSGAAMIISEYKWIIIAIAIAVLGVVVLLIVFGIIASTSLSKIQEKMSPDKMLDLVSMVK